MAQVHRVRRVDELTESGWLKEAPRRRMRRDEREEPDVRVLTLVLQVIISLLITASTMPVLLFTIPQVRDDRIGLGLAVGVFALAFLVLWLVWPRRKS